MVTPYPGTAFYEDEKRRGRIADFDFSRYSSYAPVMKYEHLAAADIERLHARSFNHFFFRWDYLRENAALLWPLLRRFGPARRGSRNGESSPAIDSACGSPHLNVPQPKSGLEVLNRKGFRTDGPHVRPKVIGERRDNS